MNVEESRMSIQEILTLYDKAESAIKKIQFINGVGLNIPAINELRYAGRHVLDGFLLADPQKANDEFLQAKDHCRRAILDAYEMGILYILDEIHLIRNDHARVIADVISGYHEKIGRVNEIKTALSELNRGHHIANNFDKLEANFKEIQGILEIFRCAVPDMYRRAKKRN